MNNDQRDAARWRALMASDRIRLMGSANIDYPVEGGSVTCPVRPDTGVHIGLELWDVHFEKHPSKNFPQEQHRAALVAYVDHIRRAKGIDHAARNAETDCCAIAAQWKTNARETWEAMVAMRNAINEYIPMPSIDGDLLQGPEASVFCAAVAEAVVGYVHKPQVQHTLAPEPLTGGEAMELQNMIMALQGDQPVLSCVYTNYRGVRRRRVFRPVKFHHASTQWHPEPCLLLQGYDMEKKALRDYKAVDFDMTTLRVEHHHAP